MGSYAYKLGDLGEEGYLRYLGRVGGIRGREGV